MNTLIQDLRYALRQLRKAPGFTLTAVLTLALGIGATTAIFTLVHAVLLHSLPVSKPSELCKIGKENDCCVESGLQGNWDIFSYPIYQQFRDNTPGFSSLAASQAGITQLNMRRDGDPSAAQSTRIRFISGNYFDTFGVSAERGRVFAAKDDAQGAAPVAVISYRLWQRRFALDPGVIGASFLFNGRAVTVIGVTSPQFYGETLQPDPPEAWMPLQQEPIFNNQSLFYSERLWLQLIGRVRPGVSPASIEPQLVVELQQFLRSRSGSMRPAEISQISKQKTELAPAATGVNILRDDYNKGLRLLITVVGFVLLIVCANLANLMLVRGMARRQQVSICVAMGAPRSRIIRQILTESVLLSIIGGLAGLAIAFTTSRAILALAFRGTTDYVPVDATPSLPVLAFAFLLSLITGVVFGLLPALITSSADPAEALRGANRSTRDASTLPQKSLVILQAALSLVLLCGAMLLTLSLRNITHQSFGFQTDSRIVAQIGPAAAGYTTAQLPDLYRKLDTRLPQIPGVETISYQMYSPMSHDNWSEFVYIPGQPPPDAKSGRWYVASWDRVSPNFFHTIGARIVQGRSISERDNQNTSLVAVVNETFAKRHFSNGNIIGQRFAIEPKMTHFFEIIGVVEDVKFVNPARPARPMFFVPMEQSVILTDPAEQPNEDESHYPGDVEVLVHGDPSPYIPSVRRALNEVDPNMPVLNISTFKDQLSTNFNQQELIARLTALFGILALVLAAIGIYGVTAYGVARRTSEIGIRMALGASRANVLHLVLRSALIQIVIGLVIGIPATLLAARAAASLLYGVSPYSAVCLAASLVILLCAAIVASLLPARRAASIDPLLALRAE